MSGELTLTLGDKAYTLRPTFAALMAMEKETATGLITLAKRFADGSFTLSDCHAIIHAGIKGAGEIPPDNLAELVFQKGIHSVSGLIAEFLKAALTGEEPIPAGKS